MSSPARPAANLKPTLDYDAGAEKTWQQTKTDGTKTTRSNNEAFITGLAAAYELDLWGRLEALRQSDVMELKATGGDLDAAAVTVSSEVATTWIDILALRQEISVLKVQIDINQRMLKLQEHRFMNGQAEALDISQQREALAEAKAKMPVLQLEGTAAAQRPEPFVGGVREPEKWPFPKRHCRS